MRVSTRATNEEIGPCNNVAIVRAHYAEVITAEEGAAYFAVKPETVGKVVTFQAA